jgi:CBS domain containing-hemolysin-like protein
VRQEKEDSILRWLKRKIFGDKGPKELQQVIDESEEKGLIDHDEGDMIEGVFDLKQTVAREIMIPRTRIVSAPLDSGIEKLLDTIIESGHSRIPIFRENVDHIAGILNAKDLLPFWLKREGEFDLQAIIREPFFVPETKQIKELLNELRSKQSHIAVIVDEYGGTSGILTMEDIVEVIVGEIRDEHDDEEELFIRQDDGSFVVKAWANLDDFEEQFEIEFPREGYDTIGGFIIHHLGKVPSKGEEICYAGLRMGILGGDRKRVTRIVVSRVSPDIESAADLPHDEPK